MYNGSMDVLGTLEEGACATRRFSKDAVPLKEIECGVYGDLLIIHQKPYSIYLRGTILLTGLLLGQRNR